MRGLASRLWGEINSRGWRETCRHAEGDTPCPANCLRAS
jgi:hypothetical protein